VDWYRLVRQQCVTPQAMGELFINPHEWTPLITERLIDFVRVRVSKGGGITQCRKIAVLCEWFGVQTAWQEGGDNDPVNQMAAVHLDMVSTSFGVQEENHFSPAEYEICPGHALLEGGYLYPNDQPGLGIDIDEDKARAVLNPELAAKSFYIAEDRRSDGSIVRP
jgi:mannonate dehydratase